MVISLTLLSACLLAATAAMPRALWVPWACWSAAFLAVAAAHAGSDTLARAPSEDSGRRLKLLYVMEYDCQFDWEPVQLEKGLTDEVLAWLMSLHDRLTMTTQQPLGQELMASCLDALVDHIDFQVTS